VENTTLSTWGGSSSITTVGTLSAGNVPWARLTSIPAATSAVDGILTASDWTIFSGKAPTLSPMFSGVPTAPTPATSDNSTTLATTAFVKAQGFLTGFSEVDPTVNSLGKATLACSTNQIAKWNGSAWICSSDAGITAETDPVWTAAVGNYYTKTNLQTSGQATVDF
jgi:hypothetical protein